MAEIDVCSPHEAIRKRAINGWLQSARTRHSLARSNALESGHSNAVIQMLTIRFAIMYVGVALRFSK